MVLVRPMSQEVRAFAQQTFSASLLRSGLNILSERWISTFSDRAESLAGDFCARSGNSGDRSLLAALRKEGMAVEFQITPAMQEVQQAVIAENVALIKSIPQQYFTRIESLVMESVSRGGDLKALSEQLSHQFNVTARRAQFIARDQTRKATSALSATRQMSVGIEEGEWLHSGGGNKPRPGHVKAGKEKRRFKLAKGCLIDGEYIMPGQLIHCGCGWRPVIPF
ncbi:hypothetical protein ABR36_10320 [Enterobacter ludwigii]|nr:hypothetical protein ABR36_10320 [Enterobacter ludwigii]